MEESRITLFNATPKKSNSFFSRSRTGILDDTEDGNVVGETYRAPPASSSRKSSGINGATMTFSEEDSIYTDANGAAFGLLAAKGDPGFTPIADEMGFYEGSTRRMVILAASFLVAFSTGTLFSFPAYATALKEDLQFTQQEINVVFMVGFFGLNFGSISGRFADVYGPKPVAAIGAALTGGGYVLMWLALRRTIEPSFPIISAFYFMVGQGSMWLYMASVITAVRCFTSERRLTRIKGVDCCFLCCAIIMAGTYRLFFDHTRSQTPELPIEDSGLALFFLFLAIFISSTTLFAAFFMRYPMPRFQASINIEDTTSQEMKAAKVRYFNSACRGLVTLLKDANFWLLLCSVSLGAGVLVTYLSNIGFLLAANMRDHLPLHLWIHALALPGGMLLGRLLAASHEQNARVFGVFVALFATTLVQIALIFALEKYPVVTLYVATGVTAISLGYIWSISPGMLAEVHSLRSFGVAWVIIMFGASLVTIALELASAEFYMDAIKEEVQLAPAADRTIDCFGHECYRLTHVTTVSLAAFASLLACALYMRNRQQIELSLTSKKRPSDSFTY